MCNEAYRRTQLGEVAQDWGQTRIPLRFPEGKPNFPPLDSIRITDRLEIIRPTADSSAAGEAEMVTRRWSWPGGGAGGGGAGRGKPVYNFRADGRTIAVGQRCLIPVDGFFEFTAPPQPDPAAPKPAKQPLKSKWAFTVPGHAWFCIAGIWRSDPAVGEAWAMLTCEPGPDIAPYHSRQVVVLTPPDYARWLDPAVPAAALCRPSPAGTLVATQVR
ncbi:MAG: SOS response-associated peptidase family protein [Pseudomonadota bacterium]